MKKYIVLLVFLTQSFAFSQELKEVTLTQIGVGKTKDASKYNALRNALEKAFGTFISSNTTLLNDELIKDEIVSVSSGNIQNFEILSETQMPDGSYSSVVKATVSIGKLISFCESKGISVEFKGGLFAANIKLQELNKKNEEAVMENLYAIANKITSKGLYVFSIKTDEPINMSGGNDAGKWDVKLNTSSEPNKNLSLIIQMLVTTLRNISLSETELQDYKSKQITAYKMTWDNEIFYFRNIIVIETVMKIIGIDIPRSACMFKIKNGITQFDFPYNNKSFNYNDNLRYFSDGREAFKSKTGVIFGKAIRRPSNEDDYKMLIEYNKVYNPYHYSFDRFNSQGIVVNTSILFTVVTNEIHNILNLDELSRITEYKIEPITN